MVNSSPLSLSFAQATSGIDQCAKVHPFCVDIEAVKVRFKNGEVVIVTQSFTEREKFGVWLSNRDPVRPNQIIPNLSREESST